MRSTILLLFLLILGPVSTFSQEGAMNLTLQEAIDYAIKHNEQLKQAALDVEISEAQVKENTAIGLPQVNGEASLNYYIDIPTQVAPPFDLGIPGIPSPDPNELQEFQFGLPYSSTAGITANQLIFDGAYFVALKASKAVVNYSRLAQEKSEIEVKNGVSQTYFSIVSLRKTYETLLENEKTLKENVEETMAMYEVGFMEKQDADQVRLSLSNITYQLAVIERRQKQIEQLLKLQIGVPQNQEIELTEDFESLLKTVDENAVDPVFNIEQHIDYRTVKQGEELSELSLAAERTKNYPKLGAFFTHSQNGFAQEFGDLFSNEYYPTTIAGMQLNVPIFSSGSRFYKTKQAKLELEKTQSQKRLLEQNLQVEALAAKQNYNSALENLQIAEDNLELANRIKKTTSTKYQEGLASSLDLAQAESQYLNTLTSYINTAQELFNANLELNTALGNY